jgi:uncharacterized protein (TIGR02118 family)
VAYPQPKDAEAFDAVYEEEHVPMAIAKLTGKTKIVATKVLQSPQGAPPFYRIAEVHFPSMQALPRCAESADQTRNTLHKLALRSPAADGSNNHRSPPR